MGDKLTFEGEVVGIHKTYFEVKLLDSIFDERIIQATLSGKMKLNRIRVIMGDRVTVELNEYDLDKGRIVYRKK